jgi:hypothetical protein
VVVGSAGVVLGANWSIDELRGTALFVESALTWLAARPMMLDIPNKPAFMAGLRVSEESIGDIVRYAVVYMPLAAALLGVAVHLRRRGNERRAGSGSGSGDESGAGSESGSDSKDAAAPAAPPAKKPRKKKPRPDPGKSEGSPP